MTRPAQIAALLIALLALAGCDREVTVLHRRSPPVIFPPFPPPLPPPTDPATARRELGRLLFFEKELSGNRTMACSSCHVLFLQASEPIPLSVGTGGTGVGPTRTVGSEGVFLARNAPDMFLRSQTSFASFFWDGRLERLPNGQIRSPVTVPFGLNLAEAQALLPLIEPDEMLGHPDQPGNDIASIATGSPSLVWSLLMSRLMTIEGYPDLFVQAFPEVPRGSHDIRHVARAIVAFEMALWERFDTAFDIPPGFFDGGTSLGDPLADEGLALFLGDAGCSRCHSGTLFSDSDFHNIGVPQFGPGKDPITHLDEGRMLVTGDPADRFAFRTPPLRNVALTAPYMHNGAFASLEAAVRHHLDPEASLRSYDGSTLPAEIAATLQTAPETLDAIAATIDPGTAPLRALTDHEVDALVAFLKALTSAVELTLTPEAGVPLAVPSGLPIDTWPGGPPPSRLANFGF